MTEGLHHRPVLAARLSKSIMHVAAGTSGSGILMAASRRTGKSTFVRQDLLPALEAAGAIVVYADLWKDLTKDPALIIVETVREAIGQVGGITESTGMEKVNSGSLSFSSDRAGLGKNIDLSTALVTLSDES